MPNLINQIRNGHNPQPQLNNDVIQQTKQMMSAFRLSANPQAYLLNILNSNPQLMNLVKSGNLQQLAMNMAKTKGINLEQLINELQN